MAAKKHAEFLNDVLSLNRRPQLKKPSRTEPTLQISEFNLVKSVTGKQGGVQLNDLTKVLKKRTKHVEISKKVSSVGKKAKTLPKPLEKPKAERIRRIVAFEKVKKQLGRWDAVVTSNRASNHLSFPLPDTRLETDKNFSGFRLKTDLQKELEELEPKVEVFSLEKESEFPLTMQEMLERRKEMAKLRALQSYKEARARRQNKIKSKKYHRVQRREKIKQQIREFEQLQKNDPVEALKKLEEIDRVRAEERASLRHRSTGKWARNKQVQAKYDKDTRQVLAQQLSLSRDLTQKLKAKENSESEEEDATTDAAFGKSNDNNPWTNPVKTASEIDEFLSGYRKFWDNENKKSLGQNENVINSKLQEYDDINSKGFKVSVKQTIEEENATTEDVLLEISDHDRKLEVEKACQVYETEVVEDKKLENLDKQNEIHASPKEPNKRQLLKISEVIVNKTVHSKSENIKKSTQNLNKQKEKNQLVEKPLKTKTLHRIHVGTTEWDISSFDESDNNEDDFDEIFDNFDKKFQNTLRNKYQKLKQKIKQNIAQKVKQRKPKTHKSENKIDLSFSLPPTRPVIDEELLQNETIDEATNKNSLDVLEAILKHNSENEKPTRKNAAMDNIDPNNIIKTKPANLNTDIPDLLTLEDNEENADQKGTISEAFEDDDIVDEFGKDKRAEIEGEKPDDINLTLPGWGSWGGTGVKVSKRKNKRFIIKFPKKLKRRDENKGNLIINEKANEKIKQHLVSEVPFPFKRVKEFEASVRAPIGNTFVPETAYRRMIRPALKTKMGTIIEPMTEDILLRKKK